MLVSMILALAAAAQTPAAVVQPPQAGQTAEAPESADSKLIDTAYGFISSGKPEQAMPVLDGVISRMTTHYAREKRQIYTPRTTTESLYYMGLAASQKKSAIAIDPAWSMALFLKGFALIDLNRPDEAKPLFDKAIAMAPMNSHYLGERGEWFKSRHDWPKAYADFSLAEEAAEFSPDDMKSFDKRRAWRGMAFVLVEQGKLDQAEALLRKALAMDPNDDHAKKELDYIQSARAPTK
jgi:tetratricopeptide (TPR) repeat protein